MVAASEHIYVWRLGGLYSHHGIDAGDGTVIHYTGDDWRSSRVRRTSLDAFADGNPVHVRSYEAFFGVASFEDLLIRRTNLRIQRWAESLRGLPPSDVDPSPDAVLRRAASRLGDGGFDFFVNNCEHFATWCRTGLHDSRQIAAIWRFALNPPKYAMTRASSWLTASFDRSSRPARFGA